MNSLEKLLAKNMVRFGTKNLNEQGPPYGPDNSNSMTGRPDPSQNSTDPYPGGIVKAPEGASQVVPYKVVQNDSLWSIATNWIRKYAQIATPSDDQIKNFVKMIVQDTNSLANFKNLDLAGADTKIKDPNLIKPGMTLYLPIDKTEILKVYK